jgi:hypothetical protein
MAPVSEASNLYRGLKERISEALFRRPRIPGRLGVMSNSMAERRSPLGLFPFDPTLRLYDRVVEVLRTRYYPTDLERFCAGHPKQELDRPTREG